ncbi:MAG: hypothetical protein ACLU6Y_06545 [Ruminococcus sp.]
MDGSISKRKRKCRKTVMWQPNQHTPDEVSIPVSKSWDDSNNQGRKASGRSRSQQL